VPALQAAESRDAVRHTTSTNARRWPDSGNPPRPISNPAPRSSRAQRRLGFGSKRRKNGAASEPIVDVDPNKRKRAGGLAGTKAIDRLHCCILPVHGGCTDLLLLPGAATASHLHSGGLPGRSCSSHPLARPHSKRLPRKAGAAIRGLPPHVTTRRNAMDKKDVAILPFHLQFALRPTCCSALIPVLKRRQKRWSLAPSPTEQSSRQ
jgi:hypothetical protein